MKEYFLSEDGRFRAETVFVSIIPRLFPDTRRTLSDEEKIADFRMNYSELPMISLKDFVEPDSRMRENFKTILKETDYHRRVKKIMASVPAAIMSVRVKCRCDIENIEEKLCGYNSIIALEIPIGDDPGDVFERLKRMSWIWFAARSVDGRFFIVIVPLKNKDYLKHRIYYQHLKEDLKRIGVEVTERCASLSTIVFQTYDVEAWRNDDCRLYQLPDLQGNVCKEE